MFYQLPKYKKETMKIRTQIDRIKKHFAALCIIFFIALLMMYGAQF